MPRAAPFIASANGGEFSPRMDARTDFEKYATAISRGLNLICLPHGGVSRRPGSRFIKEVKDSSTVGKLLPFEPVSGTSYAVEMGATYFRFYRNQARLTAPSTTAAITNGTFASNITSWTNKSTGGTAAISWDSAGARMKLAGAASGHAWAEQAITVPTGQVTVIRFQLAGNLDSTATVQIGTATGTLDVLEYRNMGMGWHVIGFTPSVTTVYFQVKNENNDTIYLDTVETLSSVPLELTSPYAATDVGTLRTAQSADVAYLFHDDYAPYKLQRRGDESWSLVRVFFADGPWLSVNPDTDLAATQLVKNSRYDNGVQDWTSSSTGNGYVNYDSVSRAVLFQCSAAGASTGTIKQTVTTANANATHVLHYNIVGGGTVSVAVGSSDGETDYLNAASKPAGWYSASFTPTGTSLFLQATASPGQTPIESGIAAAFIYTTNARLLQPSARTGDGVTVTALGDFKPFASTDVGRLIRFEYPGREPGYGVVTAYTSQQAVTIRVIRDLKDTAPLETWRLGAWSDTTGWPHVPTFYQQRLFAGRTAIQAQTLWGSQTADFENMRPDSWVTGATTVEDNDAIAVTIASKEVSPITWLVGSRRLIVGTGTGQWVMSSKGAALTPSDISADPQSSVKALDIAPVQVDTVGLFAQRAKRALYDLGYSYQVDAFQAADITILADHITKPKIAQLAYQAEPFSNVWVRMEDGTLASLTYKRGHNVVGWTPVELAETVGGDAVVEDIITIPGDDDSSQTYSSIDRNEVWMIVKRTIGGATMRYIEMFEGHFDGPNRAEYLDKSEFRDAVRAQQVDAFYLDCGLTYQGAAATTITGLDHLEGESVIVWADGASQPARTVSGGSITLDAAASTVHVGLAYNWLYRSLKLPFGSPTGPGVGQTKNINELVFVLRDAGGFEYAVDQLGDGDEQSASLDFDPAPFRTPADEMGVAIPLFTGEVIFNPDGGWTTDPRVVMQGLGDAAPWTLLGIVPKITEDEA